ncbi:hypothetical protein Pflav_018350 [Phytohabitans flavus]|uniref:Uncharacterized protein n=1 Tax=Phytohabitans flavus TaxID=1076124 RepID=A0A6F8XNL9_9ACTN|nr:hypothetical protein [Phytohabitans flavus]BCB75425.1 hypothetical protein Pflav_018350 [Phytohabitans flavus]
MTNSNFSGVKRPEFEHMTHAHARAASRLSRLSHELWVELTKADLGTSAAIRIRDIAAEMQNEANDLQRRQRLFAEMDRLGTNIKVGQPNGLYWKLPDGPLDPTADVRFALTLARKGKALTDAELQQLALTLRRHRGDETFAAIFASGLGARGTLEFWGGVSEWAGQKGKERQAILKDLQKEFGHTLARATSMDSAAMEQWKREIISLGGQEINLSPAIREPRGFQIMSSLLRHGAYDTKFLVNYGKALIEYDKGGGKDLERFWTHFGRRDFNVGNQQDAGNDPMTGLMEALGHNPDAAIGVLKDDKIFKYVMAERAWFKDTLGASENEIVAGRDALGHALQAATTGRQYDQAPIDLDPRKGKGHTADQAALFQELIKLVSRDTTRAYPEIRDSLGRIAAEYIPDINRVLSAETVGGEKNAALFPTVGSSFGPGEAAPTRSEVARFLYEVSKDPDGYAPVLLSQKHYTSGLIDYHLQHPDRYLSLTDDGWETVHLATHAAGAVHGILALGRWNTTTGEAAEDDKKYNDSLGTRMDWIAGAPARSLGSGRRSSRRLRLVRPSPVGLPRFSGSSTSRSPRSSSTTRWKAVCTPMARKSKLRGRKL